MRAATLIAVLVSLIPFSSASAQTGTIEGRVIHAGSGSPLSDIRITLEGTDRGTITGLEGAFILSEVVAGPHTVVAEAMGYGSERHEIRLGVGQTVELQVELAEEAIEIGGITVVARRGGFVANDAAMVGKLEVPPVELSQSISVLTRAQLEIQNVTSFAEAARYTPGVQTEPFGQEPRLTFIRLRGFDATTTGLYQDGLQLRNPGFAVGYNLEPYGAERIEVLRGPASVLFGAGSPGGIVNYVSKRPLTVPFREAEVELGSYDRIEGKVDLTGPVDDEGKLAYRLVGLLRRGDTQIDFIGNDRLFLSPSLRWQLGDRTSLTLVGHFKEDETRSSQALPASGLLFDNPHGEIPVERFTGEPDVDRYDRKHLAASYELKHDRGSWSLTQNARYYDVELDDVTVFTTGIMDDERTITRSIFGSFGEMSGVAVDNRARLEVNTGSVGHRIVAGLDLQTIDASSLQTFGSAPSLDIFDPSYGSPVEDPPPFADRTTEQRQVGLYLQDRIELGSGLVLALAARQDWARTESQDAIAESSTEQDDSEFSGRAGLSYQLDSGFMPYVNYAESFLPVVGSDSDGNAFEPEAGKQLEAGLKYAPSAWNGHLTLALFDLTRENFTQFHPETFEQLQTGEITSRGLELEAVAGLDSGLDLVGSLTLVDVEITESVNPAEIGETPTQTPDRMASLWANYAVQSGALEGLGFGAGVRHLGKTFGDVPNMLEVPSVTLVDGVVHYDWNGFRFGLNAQNLFDEVYVASAFRRASPLATFGPARKMTATVRYRW